jgi:hypothetical protein
MANREHLAVVLAGPESIARWRQSHDRETLDLRQAVLRIANFRNADLRNADCTDADFSAADLEGSDLRGGIFVGARFDGGSLNFANCEDADFSFALLQETSLGGANLTNSILNGANVVGARFVLRSGEVATVTGATLRGLITTSPDQTSLTGGFFELAVVNGLAEARIGRETRSYLSSVLSEAAKPDQRARDTLGIIDRASDISARILGQK